jgi:hypothetical protein
MIRENTGSGIIQVFHTDGVREILEIWYIKVMVNFICSEYTHIKVVTVHLQQPEERVVLIWADISCVIFH